MGANVASRGENDRSHSANEAVDARQDTSRERPAHAWAYARTFVRSVETSGEGRRVVLRPPAYREGDRAGDVIVRRYCNP